jgi:hypothetical protein
VLLADFFTAIGLVIIDVTGYGLSLRFYLLAQRIFGAARTGSVFAFVPYIGAIGAFAMGDRSGIAFMVMAGALMMQGVLLHLMEAHAYEHTHDPLEQERSHRHDDGHHDHVHELMPTVPHNHRHKHEPVTLSHAHVPDAHHGHSH